MMARSAAEMPQLNGVYISMSTGTAMTTAKNATGTGHRYHTDIAIIDASRVSIKRLRWWGSSVRTASRITKSYPSTCKALTGRIDAEDDELDDELEDDELEDDELDDELGDDELEDDELEDDELEDDELARLDCGMIMI